MKKHILQENYERFFGKREFGDPLPTFEDVMEKHQSVKEYGDWWANMSAPSQAAYIKKHPGSKQAQDDRDIDAEKEKFKADQKKKQAAGVPKSLAAKEKEEPEDKPDDRYASYDDMTAMLDDPDEPEYRTDDPEDKKEPEEKPLPQSAKNISVKDLASGDFDPEDDDGNYLGSEDYNHEEAWESPDLTGITNKTDPTTLKQKYIDLDLHVLEKEKEIEHYQDTDQKDGYNRSWLQWQKAKSAQKNILKSLKQKSSGGGMMGALGHRGSNYRTGTELNQETLMIDGKQFRRISEGVKPKPKPTYAFSEFYQRFKRQEN